MLKNIFIKILILSIFAIVLSPVLCASDSYALGDAFSAGKGFLEKGTGIDSTLDTGKLEETSDAIYNTLLGIAVAIAVIVAMVLGIQFMAASADEKAKVKEALMPFVVGCIVVFGSFTIWKAAVNLGNKTEGTIQVGAGLTFDNAEFPSNINSSTVSDMKQNAVYFIDGGGDLSTVPTDVILNWSNTITKHYYEKTSGDTKEYWKKYKEVLNEEYDKR